MRVLVQAIADELPDGEWLITVTGRYDHDEPGADRTRIYRIAAASDNLAAQEGIRRFVDEAQAARPGEFV